MSDKKTTNNVMNHEVAKECTHLSDEEKITFPEIIHRLSEAGIELYYTDLLAPSKTYYANDTSYTLDCSFQSKKVADIFNFEGVIDAIRQIQSGQIQYQELIRKLMDSGVICYIVFIKGRKVIYFGRRGEYHVEEFPK
jgi:uncharacterized protein YbcV (DUF1398 family)